MGWTGVDLFFVLSGFLIGGILMDNRDASNYFSTFYIRRAARILPLYAVFILIVSYRDTYSSYISFPFFVQNITWAFNGDWGQTPAAITWSLCVEEQFYFLFPLLVWLTPPKGLPYVVVGLALCAPIFRLFVPPDSAYILLPARMDALLIGALIAWAKRYAWPGNSVWLLPAFAASAMAFAGISLAFSNPMFANSLSYTVIAVFYGLLLIVMIEYNVKFGPLQWVGLGAYSIYLFHYTFFKAASASHLPLPSLVALLMTFVFAWVSWRCIEAPLIKRYRPSYAFGSGPTLNPGHVPVTVNHNPSQSY
jgi:peptidoglycan/LPS O-acetylase OafA/YrhL